MASSHHGADVPWHGGTIAPGHFGWLIVRHCGITMPWNDDTSAPRHPGTSAQPNLGLPIPHHLPTATLKTRGADGRCFPQRTKGGNPVRSIAWLSEKGGPGKSTCAINSAVGLAKLGRKVLVIDADPQANASMIFLQGRPAEAPTLFHVLTNEADASEAIARTTIPGVDLIPSDGMLADANVVLVSELGRERRLRLAMQGVDAGYDFVVIDTSPQRTLVNVNVLNYVAEVYCPVDPGIFAIAGLVKLQEAVAGVVKFLDNPGLHIAGLVVNRVQRDNLSRDTETQLRGAFGELVMKTTVPASTKIGESHARFLSVLDYAPGSTGAKAFEALTGEIIAHGADHRSGNGIDGVAEVDRAPDRGGTGRRRRAS